MEAAVPSPSPLGGLRPLTLEWLATLAQLDDFARLIGGTAPPTVGKATSIHRAGFASLPREWIAKPLTGDGGGYTTLVGRATVNLQWGTTSPTIRAATSLQQVGFTRTPVSGAAKPPKMESGD